VETDTTEDIAGHRAQKYVVRVDAQLFQEVWVAPDLQLGADLDPRQLQEFEHRISRALAGRRRKIHEALSRDPGYTALYQKGFPLRSRSFFGRAVVGREVWRIAPAEVPAGEFAVPGGFMKVLLPHLLEVRDDLSR